MREVPVQEIPPHLKSRFDEENHLNQKLEGDQGFLDDCGQVHIVTFDIIKNWTENGLMQAPYDIYNSTRFALNEEQRFKVMCGKKDKIGDLLTKLRKQKIKLTSELMLYKVKYDSKQGLHTFNYVTRDQYSIDIF